MPLVSSNRLDQVFAAQSRPREIAGHEVLLGRARVLPQKDRLILELAFKNNLTIRQIARIFERPAGSISRTVNRLCARLRDPLVAALLEPDCPLSPQYHAIAIEYFAQGRRLEELMRAHQLSRSALRGILNFVRGWYRGVHVDGRRAAGRL